MYRTIIRPALEYASTDWSSQTKQNIEKLETVQARCLRLYKSDIQLESLKERRDRTDLIDIYKF